ncbi:hypothetical protein ABZS66_10795 [Dactylosporangium sp. NPDC005572]|uniref:effector-associated constant component EACC1 n=1 Tax=Dactylosporangium sp. NPDC005572 TaxID=3156889 RepID=UPI0033B1A182
MQISVDDRERLDDLWSLQEWLGHEPDLAGAVRLTTARPEGHELGAADVLSVAVGSGGAIAVLAASLRAWFAQPRRSDVKLTLSRGDTRIELDAKRVADVAEVIRALSELENGGDRGVPA